MSRLRPGIDSTARRNRSATRFGVSSVTRRRPASPRAWARPGSWSKPPSARGERFGIARRHQHPGLAVSHDFGHGRRSARHHRQPGRHGFEKHDAEPLLHRRQAEDVGADVLRREALSRDVAQEDHRLGEAQLSVQAHQPRIFRPLSYDADLHVGDSGAEHGGGVQEVLEALARVHARDGEHDGTPVWGRRGARELGVPGLEVDGLRHHGEAIGGHAVHSPGHLRAIATRHHDEVGAAGIEALPARLQREERAHPAALVPELIGDDALEARHERHPPAPGPEKAVEIHPHHEVDVARGRQANAGIVEPSVEGVKAGAAPQRPHGHLVTQGREAAVQPRDPHERSAALPRVQRRGGEDRDAQGRPGPDRGYRPRNRGDRFSRNARVPSL